MEKTKKMYSAAN